MPPKRKSPAATAAVGSPRKTRSMAAGKQRAEAPAKAAKKEAAAAAAPPEQKGRKRAKKEDAEVAAAAEKDSGAVVSGGKRIVVEACTQCRQFKIRAAKVKEDLESSVPGVSVVINPEKPRRGCLEIREEGGEVFISLLNMPRPFTAMKKLDMDEVIKDIANKIS
uniref:Selenoprotein H n=1 Tax=Oryza nivara TaxID=4536 RepID=A0A0E0J5I7_ORYNI